MTTAAIPTADGTFTAYFSGTGLARLDFPAAGHVLRGNRSGLSAEASAWLSLTERALEQALAGKSPSRLPPFDLSGGTEFQRCVWNALREIRSGQTKSYAQVAQAINRPGAVRAVGQACGANPIPVMIPCHRVLAAGGKRGGFSAGMDWKLKLLRREGVVPEPD